MQRAIELHFSMSSEYASWDHALSLLRTVQADVEQMTAFSRCANGRTHSMRSGIARS